MEGISHWVHRVLPPPPPDLVGGPALWPLWRRHCPAGLEPLRPLGYCRGRLFVAVPGSAFAARLRQQQAALIDALRREPPLARLTAIVGRPWVEASRAVVVARPARTATGAPCVAALASMVGDTDLRASLDRLARTLGRTGHHPGGDMPVS